jgi:hypothetical protein
MASPATPPTTLAPKKARKPKLVRGTSPSTTLLGVHETIEGLANIEMSPPHLPREDTPEYQQTHKLLVFDKDTPCKVCGVRHSDLQDPVRRADPKINPFKATAQESHHYPVERSLLDAVDWRKIHNDYPAVYSQASLVMWVDSPENMLILCDQHHRSLSRGIHHLPTQDFIIQQYLLDGYIIAATQKDAAAALAVDEQIERASGIEQAVDAQMGVTTPAPLSAPVPAAGTAVVSVTVSASATPVPPAPAVTPATKRTRRPSHSSAKPRSKKVAP